MDAEKSQCGWANGRAAVHNHGQHRYRLLASGIGLELAAKRKPCDSKLVGQQQLNDRQRHELSESDFNDGKFVFSSDAALKLVKPRS
jgi:hypothetical protein